jgi:hypothetical protein
VSEPKPFASLSSGLLARKGAARPAMRPQGFTPSSSGLEDLGWNDMGVEAPQPEARGADQIVDHPRATQHRTGLTPVQSPVHSQQAELADRLGDSDEEFDEDFDETAEPYEPEARSDSPAAFADEDSEEAPEQEFKLQTKPAKRPLDLGPGPETADEPEALELDEALVFEPAPEPAPVVVLPTSARSTAPAVKGKAKAAFTLRLDPERHLKLRLACAVRGRSAQQLVTDALDQLLGGMPELDDMADKAKNRG